MTRYPKQGKGRKWVVTELKAIPRTWKGDTLSDGDGLSGEVRCLADGSISIRWKYAFRWGEKINWFQAGTWPASNMEEVRARRDEARGQLKKGWNPNDRKQADRIEAQQETEAVLAAAAAEAAEEETVLDMFNAWIENGVKRQDGNAEIRRAFNKDVLPKLGTKTVRQLTEDDLRDVLKAMVARGVNRMAVQVGNDIKQMFDWAEKRQPWRKLLSEGNPAALIELEKIVASDYDMDDERERVLDPAEIRELWNRCESMTETYEKAPAGTKYGVPRPLQRSSQLALWLCLSTLSRIGELLMAEWVHVDFENRTWFIPKENVKGKKGKKQEHLVFLSDFAIQVLRELQKLTGETPWLFPAKNVDTGHVDVKSVSKQIGDRQEQFKNRTGKLKGRRQDNTLVLADGANGDWTPHDLRRTGATMMQALGVSLDVIDRCQNHVLPGSKVRRAYMHHNYADEKRDAWHRLGIRLEVILGIAKPRLQENSPWMGGRQVMEADT